MNEKREKRENPRDNGEEKRNGQSKVTCPFGKMPK